MALQHGLKTVPNDKTNLAFYDDFGKLPDQSIGNDVYNDFEAVKIQLVDYAGVLSYCPPFHTTFSKQLIYQVLIYMYCGND